MKTTRKHLIKILSLCLALCLTTAPFALAADAEFTIPTHSGDVYGIVDAEGMLAIADDPDARYTLCCDIDMSGYDWVPFAFGGELEGNGYSILNLNITSYSDETRTVFDENGDAYEAHFAGLFGMMENGYVRELRLVGINYDIDTNGENVFCGGLAGYMNASYAETINISGRMQLNAGATASAGADTVDTPATLCGLAGLAGCGTGSRLVVCDTDIEMYTDARLSAEGTALGDTEIYASELITDTVGHADCANPKMTETVYEHTQDSFGYTQHSCSSCGYTYNDNYTTKLVPIEECTLTFSKFIIEGEEETDKVYLGDTGALVLKITPFNATLGQLELISDSEAVVIGEAQTVSNGADLFITSEVDFNVATASTEGAQGDHHIVATMDGEEIASVDVTVEGVFASWWQSYGLWVSILVGAAIFVSGLSTALILLSVKKYKKKE